MAPSIRTLGDNYTHQHYSVDFFEEDLFVTVTRTPSVIRRWIHHVRFRNHVPSHRLVVGVGVQWTPPGYNDDSESYNYDAPADTLQLCVGKRCIIIQLSHCYRVPHALRRFLKDPRVTFVGVWNSQDARKLKGSRHQLEIVKLLDLRKFLEDSSGRSLRRCSFEKIVEECMGHQGVRLHREISMSDWSAYNLCDNQILQASIDVYVCSKLGVREHLWEY